jgi:hypothetical protein
MLCDMDALMVNVIALYVVWDHPFEDKGVPPVEYNYTIHYSGGTPLQPESSALLRSCKGVVIDAPSI